MLDTRNAVWALPLSLLENRYCRNHLFLEKKHEVEPVANLEA